MTFHLNPNYVYCVDLRDIKLTHKDGRKLVLDYPQAAIFDMLLKQYSSDTRIRMMRHIGILSEQHARQLINDTIEMLVDTQVLLSE